MLHFSAGATVVQRGALSSADRSHLEEQIAHLLHNAVDPASWQPGSQRDALLCDLVVLTDVLVYLGSRPVSARASYAMALLLYGPPLLVPQLEPAPLVTQRWLRQLSRFVACVPHLEPQLDALRARLKRAKEVAF